MEKVYQFVKYEKIEISEVVVLLLRYSMSDKDVS